MPLFIKIDFAGFFANVVYAVISFATDGGANGSLTALNIFMWITGILYLIGLVVSAFYEKIWYILIDIIVTVLFWYLACAAIFSIALGLLLIAIGVIFIYWILKFVFV